MYSQPKGTVVFYPSRALMTFTQFGHLTSKTCLQVLCLLLSLPSLRSKLQLPLDQRGISITVLLGKASNLPLNHSRHRWNGLFWNLCSWHNCLSLPSAASCPTVLSSHCSSWLWSASSLVLAPVCETILHLALHHTPTHAFCSSSSLESILFLGPHSTNARMQGSASVHKDVCLTTEVYQAPFLSFLCFLTFNGTVTHPQSLWRTRPLHTHDGQMMSHWWHLWGM